MAPVPKENQNNKPPNSKDDSEISDFSNPNQLTPIDIMGSSDESDSDTDSSPGGYTLLPQDPMDNQDSDSEGEQDEDHHEYINTNSQSIAAFCDLPMAAATCSVDTVPDAVILSECGASAPTVTATHGTLHPNFLEKFPGGKIPAYNQVPAASKQVEEQLWNKERQTQSDSLDTAQENQILKAMSSFSLPAENIPPWAQALSEDQWQNQVLHRIKDGPKREQEVPNVWEDKSTEEESSNTWTANFETNNS